MRPHLSPSPRRTHLVEPTVTHMPVVVLSESTNLTVVSADGRPLLEIRCDANGPSIRMAQDNLRIECPGQLDLAAKSITMQATEDVVIQGRTIRLN
jgi:hypothetical protein